MKSLEENRRCRKIMSTNCYSYPTTVYEADLKTADNIDFYNEFSLSEVQLSIILKPKNAVPLLTRHKQFR